MNATEVNGTICIICSSSCVGIIHSQDGLDQGNITLIPRTVTDSGQNCTESIPQGKYFAAIFNLSSKKLINDLPSYKAIILIGSPTSTPPGTPVLELHTILIANTCADAHTTDARTTAPPVVENSATAIGGDLYDYISDQGYNR